VREVGVWVGWDIGKEALEFLFHRLFPPDRENMESVFQEVLIKKVAHVRMSCRKNCFYFVIQSEIGHRK
jgi:hypothetical protein